MNDGDKDAFYCFVKKGLGERVFNMTVNNKAGSGSNKSGVNDWLDLGDKGCVLLLREEGGWAPVFLRCRLIIGECE